MSYTRAAEYAQGTGNDKWILLGSPAGAGAVVSGGEFVTVPVNVENGRELAFLYWQGSVHPQTEPAFGFLNPNTAHIGDGAPYQDLINLQGRGLALPQDYGFGQGGSDVAVLFINVDYDATDGSGSHFPVPTPPAVYVPSDIDSDHVEHGDFYLFPPHSANTQVWPGGCWEFFINNPAYVAPPFVPPDDPGDITECDPLDPPWPYLSPYMTVQPGPVGIIRRGRSL